MEKETFILRSEWYDAIKELDESCKAQILDNFFLFHSNEETKINLKNPLVNLVWKLIEPNLYRNADAYDKRKETSKENGKLGGRPKKEETKKKPKKPNETLSDSVSVSDSVFDYDSVDDNDLIFPDGFKEIWIDYLQYRKSKKISKYSEKKYEQIAIDKLVSISNKNPNTARDILNQTIANNWSGLFKLKDQIQKPDTKQFEKKDNQRGLTSII